MKPYYDDGRVTIYHGDCRELPVLLERVDAVVTDPPYGVGMKDFDDDFEATIDGLVMANAGLAAVFMSPRRVCELAARLKDAWKYERLLWMHKEADMAAPWRGWCMNSEAIMVLSAEEPWWPTPQTYRSDVYRVGPWERTGHPNGKPLAVVRDLVFRLAASSVIDPFMGSGTTLRAAKDLGIRAIGIEVEERYCEMAAKRMGQEVLDVA